MVMKLNFSFGVDEKTKKKETESKLLDFYFELRNQCAP